MRRASTIILQIPAFLLECAVRLYQVAVSPLLVGNCKFIPSCSEYCIQAIHEWGVFRGSWLAVKRIARCRPGTLGGIDPVPRRPDHEDTKAQSRNRDALAAESASSAETED